MKRGAVIEGDYRYSLTREWSDGPRCLWVMLNPSTADALRDDPTIRKCIGFAKKWDCGSIEVVNLYAYRSTSPKRLADAGFPIGINNDRSIAEASARASIVVLAWGNNARMDRAMTVTKRLMAREDNVYTLGKTKVGHPRHPLYVSYSQKLIKL